jgi:hypothetical protein
MGIRQGYYLQRNIVQPINIPMTMRFSFITLHAPDFAGDASASDLKLDLTPGTKIGKESLTFGAYDRWRFCFVFGSIISLIYVTSFDENNCQPASGKS